MQHKLKKFSQALKLQNGILKGLTKKKSKIRKQEINRENKNLFDHFRPLK